jgi:hypothetical protein
MKVDDTKMKFTYRGVTVSVTLLTQPMKGDTVDTLLLLLMSVQDIQLRDGSV